MTLRSLALVAALGSCPVADADAQVRQPPRPAVEHPAFAVRGYADFGLDRLSASRSFNAIFGTESGSILGGGGEVVLARNWFARVGVWRLKDTGERAVRIANQTYRLGIPLTVTIVPVEVSAGYRQPLGAGKLFVAYAGGGFSSYKYKETSDFAEPAENVGERFSGYHVLGGLEYRLHRWVAVAGEVQYTSVPDALGAGGLSAEFDEDNLGGLILRARLLIGR